MTSQFRPEIAGLRTIAVLGVVLFHLKIPGFSGGFAGVDIFF
jgi:peptidoglycan/LPS O-acetylase OafA/YrhL